MGQDGCPELEAQEIGEQLAFKDELGLAGTLGPRLGKCGIKLDAPALEALRADEDASEAARRPSVWLGVFAAAVEEQMVGAAWGERVGPGGP